MRNLPFQAKESALRELASKAGFVWQLTVPRGTDGRSAADVIGHESKFWLEIGSSCFVRCEMCVSSSLDKQWTSER